MKRLNQAGFSALEAVLIIVVLGIVGFVGYYVYHSNQSTNKIYNQASNEAQSNPQKSAASPVKTTYSKVPKALQTVILADTTAQSPSCVSGGKLVDIDGKATDQSVEYDASGFAVTAIGCDSSAATLYVKTGATWKNVESTQFGFSCDILKQNKVPVALIALEGNSTTAPQCSNGTTGLVDYKL
jgi:Tfp pilus assembly protein PilV